MPDPHDRQPNLDLDLDRVAEHVALLQQATSDDLDELLTELLVHTHRSGAAQRN